MKREHPEANLALLLLWHLSLFSLIEFEPDSTVLVQNNVQDQESFSDLLDCITSV